MDSEDACSGNSAQRLGRAPGFRIHSWKNKSVPSALVRPALATAMWGLGFFNASHPSKDWDLPVCGQPTIKTLLGSLRRGSSTRILD